MRSSMILKDSVFQKEQTYTYNFSGTADFPVTSL